MTHMFAKLPAGAVAASVALLLVAAPARAETVVSATLSDLKIRLVDLDTGDGVAPQVSFDPHALSHATAFMSYGPGLDEGWVHVGASTFAPVSSTGSLGGTGGTADFTGNPLGAGATLTTTGHALPQLLGGGDAYVAADLGSTSFTLSAHTEIVVTATATTAWTVDSPLAAAVGNFDLAVVDAAGDRTPTDAVRLTVGYLGRAGYDDLTGSETMPLSVFFANDSDAPVTGLYDFGVEATANDLDVAPSAIPETSTTLLLASGLGLLALTRRRSSRDAGIRRP